MISTEQLKSEAEAMRAGLVATRRDFHAHPELGFQEVRTAGIVAKRLAELGYETQSGVGKTGVVGVLEGASPDGETLLLRFDMDALPIEEQVDVPFKSLTPGVMHACGHDAHTAILMGLAEALVAVRTRLPGSVVLLFQPAEEGAPEGEEGGAALMLKEGVFEKYKPEAAFGLHVTPIMRTGQVGYRAGPMFAASDSFRIVVHGRGTHGARPWGGVDPIVISAQVIDALQTIVSRQVDITANPAVVTIGAIKGGSRNNVVPDEVEMIGTIRTFDAQQRADVFARVKRTVEGTAAANGATAVFEPEAQGTPVAVNDPALTREAVAALARVVGEANVRQVPLITGAEDFGFFAQRVPAFYFYLGITPPQANLAQVAMNHTSRFYLDEAGLGIGARALAAVAIDYLRAAREEPVKSARR